MHTDDFLVSLWAYGSPLPHDLTSDQLEQLLGQLTRSRRTMEVPIRGGPVRGGAVFSPLFYSIVRYVEQSMSDEDLLRLLDHDPPIVRVLAMVAAAKRPHFEPAMQLLEQDQQVLFVANSKGTHFTTSVGEVARELRRDPNYLG